VTALSFDRVAGLSLRVRSGRHTLRQRRRTREARRTAGAGATERVYEGTESALYRSNVPRESIFFLSILLTFRDGRDLNPPKNHPGPVFSASLPQNSKAGAFEGTLDSCLSRRLVVTAL
jgi:hypothetical protein